MSAALWAKVIIVVVPAIIVICRYLTNDKYRLEKLTKKLEQKEKEYEKALANNDTESLSVISHELDELRQKISRLKKQRNDTHNSKGRKI
jgi:uncharacterized membrane protein (DUF106 family)